MAVTHAYNPNTRETGGLLGTQSQPGARKRLSGQSELQSKALSHKTQGGGSKRQSPIKEENKSRKKVNKTKSWFSEMSKIKNL